MTSPSANDRAWLDRFRDVSLTPDLLSTLLDEELSPEEPLFVPRRDGSGTLTWYALARSERTGRELREHLLAFLGPSYSDFTGQRAVLDPGDPIEAMLLERGGVVYHLRIPRQEDEQHSTTQLLLLRALLRERPTFPPPRPRTLEELLRDFELVLSGSRFAEAARLLDELQQRGQLAARELASLRVRLLAARGAWGDVLALAESVGLLHARLPSRVGEAIALGVHQRELASFRESNEPALAVEACRERVLPSFGRILSAWSSWRDPLALESVLVAELARPSPSPETLDRLRSVLPENDYVRGLLATLEPTPEPPAIENPLEAAHEALDQGDFDAALRLVLEVPASVESLRLVLESADELGTLEAARSAAGAMAECDEALTEQVVARRGIRRSWEAILELASAPDSPDEQGPTSWPEWMTRICHSHWPSAVAVAERGAREWSLNALLGDDKALQRFEGQLGEADTAHAQAAIRGGLPYLLEVFLPGGIANPRWKRFYLRLLELTVLDDALTPAATSAIRDLAQASLRSHLVASATDNEYDTLMECLVLAWDALRRPTLLEWGFELLDLLAEHAVHRSADVTPLLQSILEEFDRVRGRSSFGQWAVLETIVDELEQGELFAMVRPPVVEDEAETDEETRFRERLDGKHVALLTMGDRIAAVFRETLRKRFPKTRVTILQEKDGSKRLRDVSKSADVFIVNTYDVPHAATGFVPQHRASDAVTLYPEGKTAARQIDVLETWLRS